MRSSTSAYAELTAEEFMFDHTKFHFTMSLLNWFTQLLIGPRIDDHVHVCITIKMLSFQELDAAEQRQTKQPALSSPMR